MCADRERLVNMFNNIPQEELGLTNQQFQRLLTIMNDRPPQQILEQIRQTRRRRNENANERPPPVPSRRPAPPPVPCRGRAPPPVPGRRPASPPGPCPNGAQGGACRRQPAAPNLNLVNLDRRGCGAPNNITPFDQLEACVSPRQRSPAPNRAQGGACRRQPPAPNLNLVNLGRRGCGAPNNIVPFDQLGAQGDASIRQPAPSNVQVVHISRRAEGGTSRPAVPNLPIGINANRRGGVSPNEMVPFDQLIEPGQRRAAPFDQVGVPNHPFVNRGERGGLAPRNMEAINDLQLPNHPFVNRQRGNLPRNRDNVRPVRQAPPEPINIDWAAPEFENVQLRRGCSADDMDTLEMIVPDDQPIAHEYWPSAGHIEREVRERQQREGIDGSPRPKPFHIKREMKHEIKREYSESPEGIREMKYEYKKSPEENKEIREENFYPASKRKIKQEPCEPCGRRKIKQEIRPFKQSTTTDGMGTIQL